MMIFKQELVGQRDIGPDANSVCPQEATFTWSSWNMLFDSIQRKLTTLKQRNSIIGGELPELNIQGKSQFL